MRLTADARVGVRGWCAQVLASEEALQQLTQGLGCNRGGAGRSPASLQKRLGVLAHLEELAAEGKPASVHRWAQAACRPQATPCPCVIYPAHCPGRSFTPKFVRPPC